MEVAGSYEMLVTIHKPHDITSHNPRRLYFEFKCLYALLFSKKCATGKIQFCCEARTIAVRG
jgi:hypothetical protein